MDSPSYPSSSSSFDLVGRALRDYIRQHGPDAADRSARPENDQSDIAPHRTGRTGDAHEQILGAVNLDRDLRITRYNLDVPAFEGLTVEPGTAFVDLLPPGDVPTVTRRLRQVIETAQAHVARVQRLRRDDGSELVVSMSILPAATPQDGLTVSLIAMAKRLHLYASETAIGTSLDIGETAQSLAQSLLAWGTWSPSTSTTPYGPARPSSIRPRGAFG
ncbi:hypothetical protein SANT12839_098030 [Streptomyces antimycoticus]|uniref:PAS fold-4 domain-containing protein n=1 Tax=Streptomyces antimycoticus TaxID=68175 RepID=A0A4D4KID3_9ACTN|nr:hypothetical protein SANT12839_098030 [Streptomyces antimycoticus]